MPETEPHYSVERPVKRRELGYVSDEFGQTLLVYGASAGFVHRVTGKNFNAIRPPIISAPAASSSAKEETDGGYIPKARSESARPSRRLGNILVTLAGGDVALLDLVPEVRAAFLNRGALTLLSAISTGFGFALGAQTAGLNPLAVALITVGLPVLVLNIDRVLFFNANRQTRAWRRTLALAPRVVILVAVAWVVSYGVLLTTFSGTVNAVVAETQARDAIAAQHQVESENAPRIEALVEDVSDEQSRVESLQARLELATDPQVKSALAQQLEFQQQNLAQAQKALITGRAQARDQADAAYSLVVHRSGLSTRLVALRQLIDSDSSTRIFAWLLELTFAMLLLAPVLTDLLLSSGRFRVYAMLVEAKENLALAHAKAAMEVSEAVEIPGLDSPTPTVPTLEEFQHIADEARDETFAKVIAFDRARRLGT